MKNFASLLKNILTFTQNDILYIGLERLNNDTQREKKIPKIKKKKKGDIKISDLMRHTN